MRTLLRAGSFAGLALTVVPAYLVFSGTLTWRAYVTLMAIGAVLWFVTAPFWMVKKGSAQGAGGSQAP